MSGIFRRIGVLTLAISLAAWSQAVICPMLLQGRAQACSHSAAQGHPAASGTLHDCCPRKAAPLAKAHCATQQMGDAMLGCCSLDPPPAGAPKVPNSPKQQVVLGLLHVSSSPAPAWTRAVEPSSQSPGNPVFRRKEDLRI